MTAKKKKRVQKNIGTEAPARPAGAPGMVSVHLPSSGRTVRVPVGPDGNVNLNFLARTQDMASTKSFNDYNKKADVVLPANLTPRQAAAWIADPDKYDIDCVDVKGSPQRHYFGRSGKNLDVHKKIDVYAIPGQEKSIRDTIDEAFDLGDREKLVSGGRIEIESRPLQSGVLGTHCENNISLKRGKSGETNTVVVHEGVHHLRQVDRDRRSPIVKSFNAEDVKYSGKSHNPATIQGYKMQEASNVEESCTVAESMARQKNDDVSGYYMNVQVFDPKTKRYRNPTQAEAVKMAAEDRKLFAPGGKPLTGDEAVRSVEKHWKDSHISRLKLGRCMAVNTMARNKPSSGVKEISNRAPKTKTKPKPRQKQPTGTSQKPKKKTGQTTLYSRARKK